MRAVSTACADAVGAGSATAMATEASDTRQLGRFVIGTSSVLLLNRGHCIAWPTLADREIKAIDQGAVGPTISRCRYHRDVPTPLHAPHGAGFASAISVDVSASKAKRQMVLASEAARDRRAPDRCWCLAQPATGAVCVRALAAITSSSPRVKRYPAKRATIESLKSAEQLSRQNCGE